MTNAQILQLTGLVLLPIGISWVLSPRAMRQTVKDIAESKGMLLISAMVAIVMGYLILAFRSSWQSAPEVFISILGWAALLKGFGILFLSSSKLSVAGFLRKMRGYYAIMPWLVLAVGLLAIYGGYFA